MKAKSRLIIAISALVLAVAASVVAVVAVLAANRVTVQSNIAIKYKASGVMCKVEAGYYTQNTATLTAIGTAEFNGSETTDNNTQILDYTDHPVVISADSSQYIVFKFTFTNTNTTKGFTATLTSDDFDGFTVTLYEDSTLTTGDTDNSISVGTGSNATKSYYVKVAVTNPGEDAEALAGQLNWALE